MCRYEAALAEAKNRSRAAQKKGLGDGIRFEAEATAWLKSHDVATTNDDGKYAEEDIPAVVKGILSASGYVESTAELDGQIVGLVLDVTSFYAEQGGQVCCYSVTQ